MPAQLGADLEASARVKRGERLIEQQQAGIRGQGTRQRHSLGLPAGQLARLAFGVVGQPESNQPIMGNRVSRAAFNAVTPRRESNVVADGQVRKQAVILEEQPDRSSFRRHKDAHFDVDEHQIVEPDRPGRGCGQTGEHPQQGGLSSAVRPKDAQDLPRTNRELNLQLERASLHSGIHHQTIDSVGLKQ